MIWRRGGGSREKGNGEDNGNENDNCYTMAWVTSVGGFAVPGEERRGSRDERARAAVSGVLNAQPLCWVVKQTQRASELTNAPAARAQERPCPHVPVRCGGFVIALRPPTSRRQPLPFPPHVHRPLQAAANP
jgi:hypothetical protein